MTSPQQTLSSARSAQVTEAIISQLTLDSLREVFQSAGYRVEEVKDPIANAPYLRSATGGIAFDIRPGNRLAADPNAFADSALVAILQVQGGLPLDVVNRWNVSRRFARLQFSSPFLVLTLDVSAAGGVTQSYLRTNIEIWDRLLQDLVGYLRETLRELATKKSEEPAAPEKQPQPYEGGSLSSSSVSAVLQ
jgi:hypothetical protein